MGLSGQVGDWSRQELPRLALEMGKTGTLLGIPLFTRQRAAENVNPELRQNSGLKAQLWGSQE